MGITNPCLHAPNTPSSLSPLLTSSQNIDTDTDADAGNIEEDDSLWIPDGIHAYHPVNHDIGNNIPNSNHYSFQTTLRRLMTPPFLRQQQPQQQPQQQQQTPPPLRVLRYRRKVGKGDKCYTKLRDVALQWERMHEGSTWAGIRILPTSKRPMGRQQQQQQQQTTRLYNNDFDNDKKNIDNMEHHNTMMEQEDPFSPLPPNVSKNVMQIWSEPGGRKLVTMSKMKIGNANSYFWAINPCGVVYDLVDCRGGGGMTYTSTAYATLKGHLLAGEERVTVAIRDNGRSSHHPAMDHLFFTPSHAHSTTPLSSSLSSDDGDVYVEILSCSRPSPTFLGRMIFPFVKGMQDRFFQEQMDTLQRIAASDNDDDEN